MKLLLILAAVLMGVWFWRSSRAFKTGIKRNDPQSQQTPLEMVACCQCSVHVTKSEAIRGNKGFYCCNEHRQLAEH